MLVLTALVLGHSPSTPALSKNSVEIHTPEDIDTAIEKAKSAGFNNISLDLIFGNPKQTYKDFKNDITAALAHYPHHISLYSLTIEKGTPFYQRAQDNSLKLPNAEMVADMMEFAIENLPDAGFNRYEISNYAKPGFEARHNIAYWEGSDYLGLGAGAHSFNAKLGWEEKYWGKRWSNYALPKQYMNEIEGIWLC